MDEHIVVEYIQISFTFIITWNSCDFCKNLWKPDFAQNLHKPMKLGKFVMRKQIINKFT
jgi:hypothetical protein